MAVDVETALELLDNILPPGSVNAVKALIFRDAWENKGYAEIAEETGYATEYIKESGAQLWRTLIKKQSGKYGIEPMLRDYCTDNLTEKIAQELIGSDLDLFNTHALIKTNVTKKIRQSQVQSILEPIAARLRGTFTFDCTLLQVDLN